MMYNTGLLIGRAFALANSPALRRQAAVAELRHLADGDTMALRLAQARFREFCAEQPDSLEDRRALRLIDAALAEEEAIGEAAAEEAAEVSEERSLPSTSLLALV